MAATVTAGEPEEAALAAEEGRLAHAAADGDGNAFATLYERYERRAYNLAYRVTGSEDDAADAVQDAFVNVLRRLPRLRDRELAFGSYLFTATRNACYDLMQKRKRSEPSDSISESAAPVGSGATGVGLDPGDPEDDPDRRLLLESQQEEIRTANERLPERQREALALRELEELSYDEIAAIMEMNRNAVAQLISRARINLRDELRGTALASIAVSSPDCERALPLIAMRADGQLDAGSDDADWLDAHLAGCETCRLGREAMEEAGTSYRAWAPIAAAPWLFEETMARAAEAIGADWEDVAATRAGNRTDVASLPGVPGAYLPRGAQAGRRRRLKVVGGSLLAAALLVVGAVTALGDGEPSDPPNVPAAPAAEPAAAPEPEPAAAPEPQPAPKRKPAKRKDGDQAQSSAPAPSGTPTTAAQPPATEPSRPASEPSDGTTTPTRDPKPRQPREPRPKPPAGPPANPPPTEPPVIEDPPETKDPPPEEPTPPQRDPNDPNVPTDPTEPTDPREPREPTDPRRTDQPRIDPPR